MSKILLTGATGYIGRFLATYLCKQGYDVWAAIHDQTRDILLPKGVKPTTLSNAYSYNWDAIVHLAYGVEGRRSRTLQLNMSMARQVMELASHSNSKVIFASSIAVLGYCPKNLSRAQVELRDISREDVYTYVKGSLEKFILTYAQKYKIPIHIVRIGNVMGPGSRWTWLLLERLQDRIFIIDPQGFSNATYVFNLISFIADELLSANTYPSIVLSTEFSKVTWGEWIKGIIGEEIIFDDACASVVDETVCVFILHKFKKLAQKSFIIQQILDILPQSCYELLKSKFGGPQCRLLTNYVIDEVQRRVFSCKYAWPSCGSTKYSFEEACERIRAWAQKAGYPL